MNRSLTLGEANSTIIERGLRLLCLDQIIHRILPFQDPLLSLLDLLVSSHARIESQYFFARVNCFS